MRCRSRCSRSWSIIGGLIAFAPTTNQQTASNEPAVDAQCAAAGRAGRAAETTAP